MVCKSEKEVPDTVQFCVCVPSGAGNICLIGDRFFSGGQRHHEQTQHDVSRECPQSSVSPRMPRSRVEVRQE